MNDGFIRVAAATPKLRVADCEYNAGQMAQCIREACRKGAKLLVFPELSMTGYTCGDLFLQSSLLDGALSGLEEIVKLSRDEDLVIVTGLPVAFNQKLYNVGAVIQKGRILGLVPKENIPNYSEFYEARHFNPGPVKAERVKILDQETWFGSRILFSCINMNDFVLALEICEDLWCRHRPVLTTPAQGRRSSPICLPAMK